MPDDARPRRGLFFWALTPFLLVFVVLMPFLIQRHDALAIATLIGIESVAMLMLLGLYNPIKFAWAWRGVGALVFVGFASYVVAMLIQQKWQFPANRAQQNLLNAIGGMLVFGVPGLWWALFGKVPALLRAPLYGDSEGEQDRLSDS